MRCKRRRAARVARTDIEEDNAVVVAVEFLPDYNKHRVAPMEGFKKFSMNVANCMFPPPHDPRGNLWLPTNLEGMLGWT